eukprot:gene18916-biopygen11496
MYISLANDASGPAHVVRCPESRPPQDASGTCPFLQILSCGTRPRPFLPEGGAPAEVPPSLAKGKTSLKPKRNARRRAEEALEKSVGFDV